MFYIAVTISLILLYDTRNDKSINHLNSSKHTTSEGYLLLFFSCEVIIITCAGLDLNIFKWEGANNNNVNYR